jgi:hypothetical protein
MDQKKNQRTNFAIVILLIYNHSFKISKKHTLLLIAQGTNTNVVSHSMVPYRHHFLDEIKSHFLWMKRVTSILNVIGYSQQPG